MPTGRGTSLADLPPRLRQLLESERRGVMTTLGPDGAPHSVPVVFAVVGGEVVSPIDHKPKSGAVLRRVRNLERDDRLTLLVDRWTEEWSELAWVMIRGHATVDPGAPIELMRALNTRYPQYSPDEQHDALIRIRPTQIVWWSWT